MPTPRITPNMKMAEVILLDYSLLPVINRFGIQLGFGDRTIHDICQHYHLSESFFVDILNIYHDKHYFPSQQLQEYPFHIIIDYLLKTHGYYKDYVAPDIEASIQDLINSCQTKCDNLNMIHAFYTTYKEELINHLTNEEEHFFPYVEKVSEQFHSDRSTDNKTIHINFSYEEHKAEHDNVVEKLFDLKNLIIKYLPPDYDQNICNDLLYKLFMFDKDLNDHERLEDYILVPRLSYMEDQLNLRE